MTGALQQLSASQLHVLEALDGAAFVARCEIGRSAKYDDNALIAETFVCVTSVLDKIWFILDAAGLRMRLTSKTEEVEGNLRGAITAHVKAVYEVYAGTSKVAEMYVLVRASRINDAIKAMAKVKKVVIKQAVLNSASTLQL